jgi:hypothetical protein
MLPLTEAPIVWLGLLTTLTLLSLLFHDNTFQNTHKRVNKAVGTRKLEAAFERGAQLSGHQHRWYDGTAFDEWPQFRQFEVSAVKGDVFDAEMSSSFSIFEVDDAGKTTNVVRWWRENRTWMSSEEEDNNT